MIDWDFTVIRHPMRRAMGLSSNEWAYLDLHYHYQTHPSFTNGGWARLTYEEIKTALDFRKGTSSEMNRRLTEKGFMEVNPETKRLRRTTPRFYDFAYMKHPSDAVLAKVREMNVQKPVQVCSDTERGGSEIERDRSENDLLLIKYSKEGKEEKEPGTVSSSPKDSFSDQAVEVIEFFNSVTGQNRSAKKSGRGSTNVELVLRWLKHKTFKFEVQDFFDVIAFKNVEWGGEAKTRTWIRPSTLFGDKFKKYVDDADEARNNPKYRAALLAARKDKDRKAGNLISDAPETAEMAETLANSF